jgi:hypothetical protein
MKRKRINAVLTVAALALTLLILTVLPLASTAAPRLERQPLESLTALNSVETTEGGTPLSAFSVPSATSAVQSPGTTTRISAALRSSPVMFIENVSQFDTRACFLMRQRNAAGAQEVYNNDFEGAVGPEWSNTSTDTTPVGGRRFLGQFGSNTVSLTLTGLPPHLDVTVYFDLFIIRSWDGNRPSGTAQADIWNLSVGGGATLLHTTFGNGHSSTYRQAYPGTYPVGDYPDRTGAAENDSLGYTYKNTPHDSVYQLSFDFPQSADSLILSFSASGLET